MPADPGQDDYTQRLVVLMSLIASHAELDLETVARLSAASGALASDRVPGVDGTVVLSTCNRFEVYAEVADSQDVEAARSGLVQSVADAAQLPAPLVSETLSTRLDHDAVRHLFAVGAGLDSAVIGEREIAGQVRRALIGAQATGSATGQLSKLFQSASRTAKQVQSSTTLGSRGKSIVSVALDLAEDVEPGDWSDRTVVLFGTGAYAGATLALLQERKAGRIGVYSAFGRAEAFVASRSGEAVTDDTLADWLTEADVIIGCSGGSQRLEREDLIELERHDRPLVAIDLALSHDFDPALDEVDGVTLLTLESVRMAAPGEQVDSVRRANEIVADAAQEFERERLQRTADSAIVALRRHTQTVLESELEKVRAQHGCTAAADEVEFAMRRMIKQMLHIPMVRARELAESGRIDEYAAALNTLYGIDVPGLTQKPEPEAAPEASVAEAAAAAHAAHGVVPSAAQAAACPVERTPATDARTGRSA